MNRVTFEVIFNNGASEIAEIREWNIDVKFNKSIYKDFIKDAIWFFRIYTTVKTVNCYLDDKDSKQMCYGKNIVVSVDRMDDFYMVYMKNPGTYDYKMIRSFFIREQ